jgi:hypothetical protein
VTGYRAYRGHIHGDEFVARLAPGVERRAMQRGDIELVQRIDPSIDPDRLTFPDGWLDQPNPTRR